MVRLLAIALMAIYTTNVGEAVGLQESPLGCNTETKRGDCLLVTWYGPGSPQLEHRIALYVHTEEAGMQWVRFSDETGHVQPPVRRRTDPADMGTTRWGQWYWDFNLGHDSNDDPNCWIHDLYPNITLRVPYMKGVKAVRVDTRVCGDECEWKRSDPAWIL